ncbi:hypothetical protein [Micromonospora auratinigra]|uniref:Uncharacterized protein n=1 Tax=Micromonospora auratinigra TaxID=261654 RepID=A0A1A8ZY13_9ACTN|nr:hypothetical protein [Micromonospora auratinigra]SBT48726.1 hypothetical protein GA0070611_4159 [Micromonospora auratinigra]
MDGAEPSRNHRRRALRRLLTAVAAFAVLSLLVGLLARYGIPRSFRRPGEPPAAVATAGAVLAVLGLVVEVAALVRAVRSGSYRAARQSAAALPVARRRELLRAVRRGEVPADADLPTLRAVADHLVRQRWIVPMLGGLVTMHLGQALLQFSPALWALFVLTGGLCALACGQLLRDARRGAAFLRAYPPGEVAPVD